MRVWIDPDRLAAVNLAPGDVQAALQRNNYLAAVGQTKGNLVQINLLANTDLRSADEFANLIVADRNGAIVRLRDVARVELGAEEATAIAKYSEQEGVYLGIWPLVGSNELDVAKRLKAEMERIRPTLPADIEMRLVWDGTMFMRNALEEITKTLGETILIVGIAVFLFMGSIRTALVPLIAMPVSLIGAAVVMYAFGFSLNLLTMLAIVLAVGSGGGRRHRRGGERRAPRAHGQDAHRGRADRRARAARAHHRDDHHARGGVRADRLPGRPHGLAVPRVRHHARGGGDRVRLRGRDAVARS